MPRAFPWHRLLAVPAFISVVFSTTVLGSDWLALGLAIFWAVVLSALSLRRLLYEIRARL